MYLNEERNFGEGRGLDWIGADLEDGIKKFGTKLEFLQKRLRILKTDLPCFLHST